MVGGPGLVREPVRFVDRREPALDGGAGVAAGERGEVCRDRFGRGGQRREPDALALGGEVGPAGLVGAQRRGRQCMAGEVGRGVGCGEAGQG